MPPNSPRLSSFWWLNVNLCWILWMALASLVQIESLWCEFFTTPQKRRKDILIFLWFLAISTNRQWSLQIASGFATNRHHILIPICVNFPGKIPWQMWHLSSGKAAGA